MNAPWRDLQKLPYGNASPKVSPSLRYNRDQRAAAVRMKRGMLDPAQQVTSTLAIGNPPFYNIIHVNEFVRYLQSEIVHYHGER